MLAHIEDNKIIPDSQFGFRHRHSTSHAIHKVLNDINYHLHRAEFVAAALIDLEKAFDTVCTYGLLYIMRKLNFPIDIIHLVWNMTRERSVVTWNGTAISSLVFKITEGLMQGMVNSPLLFNLFTYNVTLLHDLNTNNNAYAVAYADDLIILVADKCPDAVKKSFKYL